MDLGFIHIGMMKTATTYMQNIWLTDDAYCLSWQGNLNVVNQLRTMVIKDQLSMDIKLDIKTDAACLEGQKLVISNEAFSSAYLNEIQWQHKIPQYIEYTSRILGKLSTATPNLLLVVREPISWIKSTYVQAIKQGGAGSAQQFVDNQLKFLLHSLDLEHIVNCFKRYFPNLLIIPYELFRDDESLFWNLVSEGFQVPLVTKKIDHHINQSLTPENTYILSKLNELSNVLLSGIQPAETYRNVQEKNQLMHIIDTHRKWVHRRFVEHASEEKVNEICNLLHISEPPENYFDFYIPESLEEVIRSKYINFLKQKITPEYSERYEEAFHKFVSKK